MNNIIMDLDLLHTQVKNLDNSIADMIASQKQGDDCTMHEKRKVAIGFNDDGSAIYKVIRSDSYDDMNDRIVMAYIDSGRIWDFIKRPEEIPAIPPPEVPVQKTLLKDYARDWLDRKRKLKETTRVNYRKYMEEYIIKTIGDKYVEDITARDVQFMLDEHKDRSKKTLHDMKAILSQIMRYAISDDLIRKNPCDSVDIEIPNDRVTERKALEIDQYTDIIQHLEDLNLQDRLFMSLLMFTGMRRGEVLGLRIEDIDYDNRCINISRNVTHPQKNEPVITTPKTNAGIRSIPMDESLVPLLKQLNPTGYIFGGESPFSLSAFRNLWERINKTIDLHGATPHTFRHSFITYAVGETNDYKTIQGISGHADMNTLLNRYAHPQKHKMQELGSRMHEMWTKKCN